MDLSQLSVSEGRRDLKQSSLMVAVCLRRAPLYSAWAHLKQAAPVILDEHQTLRLWISLCFVCVTMVQYRQVAIKICVAVASVSSARFLLAARRAIRTSPTGNLTSKAEISHS